MNGRGKPEERQPPAEHLHENEEIATERAMIATMRRYGSCKRRLGAYEERAKEHLRQVQEEVEEDLRPLREELSRLKGSMELFVQERNAGSKFKVPGLGVAYTTRRLSVRITDEEALVSAMSPEQAEALYERKINLTRAKKAAEDAYKENGEVLPGVEVEPQELLAVRLSGAS